MSYLLYFLFSIAILRLLITISNLLHGGRLPKKASKDIGKLSILIPARNEEKNINVLLSDLSSLSYPNFEVLIYDDDSRDNTRATVKSWKEKVPNLKLIEGHELPDGWLGKSHACRHLAQEASGQYLLFLDADIRIRDGLPQRALHFMNRNKHKLLSVLPAQLIETKTEKLFVPLYNWILLSLFPLFLVRFLPANIFTTVNGRFMLFEADTYHQLQPHKKVRDRTLEDLAIARMYKSLKMNVATVLSNNSLRCRLYTDHASALKGLQTFIRQIFGNNILLAMLFMVYSNTATLLAYLAGGYTASLLFLSLLLITRILTAISSRQVIFQHLAFMIHQQFYLIRIVIRMISSSNQKSKEWN